MRSRCCGTALLVQAATSEVTTPDWCRLWWQSLASTVKHAGHGLVAPARVVDMDQRSALLYLTTDIAIGT
jgi:hypothetical protein